MPLSVTALKTANFTLLPDPNELTRLCKALGDDLRMDILRLLKSESFGVQEISTVLDIRQSALSHHLKILASVGLVSSRREGNSIFYRRALILDSDPLEEFKNSAFANIDRLTLPDPVLQRVRLVQKERSQLSLNFFTRHAAKFAEKQGLVAELKQYASNLDGLIADMELDQSSTVLEVGPGEGELLLRLGRHFERVIGLDNAPEMLQQAQTTINRGKAENVQLLLGDTSVALQQQIKCDLMILNMVLHHIPSPGEIFAHAAQLLNPGASLLIVDLCSHDQDWVRESCGDLWLGFDSTDLEKWATDTGLVVGQGLYLGLRNGFQIQMRLFANTNN